MKSHLLDINNFSVSFSAPSNIAFIKYWGKRDRQIPLNASISMGLSHCRTEMTLSIEKSKGTQKRIKEFLFEKKSHSKFEARFENYFQSLQDILPWINDFQFIIHTHNTFPHSTGIASSASAFAALALCLQELDSKLTGVEFSWQKASLLARLGSGSACRSLYSGMVVWGENTKMPASNDYAKKIEHIHPIFENLCDSVLVVDHLEKSVKSSVGHSLMHGHLFKEVRMFQAKENFNNIFDSIQTGDIDYFGEIIELEALTLHALMMTSTPSYMLMRPNTLNLIEKIRAYRAETKNPVYFTLDAGPNIHLIYPLSIKKQVELWINQELTPYCQHNLVIHDKMGDGPRRISD